jgi:PAS domain S-box-containing protein
VASSRIFTPKLASDLSPEESAGVLRSLMANVPGAIYRISLDDGLSLRLIGEEIERISGYPADDFVCGVERTLFDIVHPDDRTRVEVELRSAVAERRPLSLDYRIVCADGEVRWVLERATTATDADGREWLDGVIFDMTDRRVAELQASRRRLVEAGDAARRRIERDLHDGAQQRFVAAALTLQVALRHAGGAPPAMQELLAEVAGQLAAGSAELRELAHGIHPSVLTARGLDAALRALADRSPVPVALTGALDRRPSPAAEAALYFTVAEALTNVAKYAEATRATVRLGRRDGRAEVEVADDGRGGARLDGGSGLRGLVDRLAALGGRLRLDSPPGGGTIVRADLPLEDLGSAVMDDAEDEAPSGLPDDAKEGQPLGPPETRPDGEGDDPPRGEDAMPGIPTEGEPPTGG